MATLPRPLLSLALILLISSSLAKVEQQHVRLGIEEEPYQIAGFSSYKKFITKLEEYYFQKLRESFNFLFHATSRNTSDFLSFVVEQRFVIFQLFYALANKDSVYANLIIQLSPHFKKEGSGELKAWLEGNLKLNGSELYDIVKYVAKRKENGLSQMPEFFVKQVLFMNEKYKIFEEACSRGDQIVVEWFIKSGHDIKILPWSIFESSWRKNQIGIIKIFLENDFLMNVRPLKEELEKEVNNKTLIHLVVELGLFESLKEMINQGANINTVDSNGKTPLFSAIETNNIKMLDNLASLGGNISFPCQVTGDSLMHYAVKKNNLEAVNLLLKLGAAVNCKNKDGLSPLHVAVKQGNIKIIYLLAFHGGDLDFETDTSDSLMHTACRAGNVEVIRALLTLGVKVDQLNKADDSPLYIAACRGAEEAVKLLIIGGAKVEREDRKGRTLLQRAAMKGELGAARLLVAKGAGLEATGSDEEERRPLWLAADEGQEEMVAWLLSAGAEPSAASQGGSTPLHRAARWGFLGVVELLLASGARPDQPGPGGITPAAIAKAYHHREVYLTLQAFLQPALHERASDYTAPTPLDH